MQHFAAFLQGRSHMAQLMEQKDMVVPPTPHPQGRRGDIDRAGGEGGLEGCNIYGSGFTGSPPPQDAPEEPPGPLLDRPKKTKLRNRHKIVEKKVDHVHPQLTLNTVARQKRK